MGRRLFIYLPFTAAQPPHAGARQRPVAEPSLYCAAWQAS